MKLKYFLRGLGIGVVVTTIILSIAHAASDKMSDADIIERAKELGMVYDSLFDNDTGNKETEGETAESTTAEGESSGSEATEGETNTTETESVQNQSTEADVSTAETSSEAAGSETRTEEHVTAETTTLASVETTSEPVTESSTAEPVKELATQVDANGVITFQLEVVRGMKSAEVAALVEAAGIVDSAKELDSFLIAGDYDNQINVGTFTINSEMSYQDIANIITGK